MKRAIGYVRVSSDKQVKEGGGLEIQKKAILQFCEKNQIQLLGIFSDEGISGVEDIEKREGLANCFSAVRKSKLEVHYVIVQKLDRFARDTILLGYLEFELKKCHCELLSVDQKFNKDPSGKLMKDIITAFASFEKNMINIRTMSGKKNKIEKRLFTGGKVPMGYKLVNSDYVQIDEKTAPIVRCIFFLRNKRFSYRKISKYVENVFFIPMHFTTIKYILSNRAYIGELRQETRYSIPVAPLISKEEFYKANSPFLIIDDEDKEEEQEEELLEYRILEAEEASNKEDEVIEYSYNKDEKEDDDEELLRIL